MAVSCARQVQGLRARDVPLDVLCFLEGGESVRVSTTCRDNGTDCVVHHRGIPALAAQRGWRWVQQQYAVRPYRCVIGFGTGWSGSVAMAFAAWLGARGVVLVRGNDFDRNWFDPRRGLHVRESLGRADAIGAVSPDAVRRIRTLFPGKDVRWSPNGVDVERWTPLSADEALCRELRAELAGGGRRVLGLFGELKYKKRVPLWLGALRDRALLERVALLIVGRLDAETEQLLADPALAPVHKRVSFRAPDAMPGYYAACDYLVLPSLFDGMPNVLLEAMAAGVVPVVSDAGAMGDVVANGKTGFTFPAEDRDAAGAATQAALDLSDEELRAMGDAAREHAREAFGSERELDVLMEMMVHPTTQ